MYFNQDYWESRWKNGETGWDIGSVSTPLKEYFDQLSNKNISVLIPGCGNAYEAEYLLKNGFSHVFVADISKTALEVFKKRVPGFPPENLLPVNYFDIQKKFDLIVEQTFFCALHPSERKDYVKKTVELLNPAGKLVGLLFDDELNSDHPPFGGNKSEYELLFGQYFVTNKMETAYNSIKPRANRELFINLRVKK